MITSITGLNLIKKWEGVRLKAYKDTANIWTIGYGSIIYSKTGQPVKEGDVITQDNADKELVIDLHDVERVIGTMIKVPLTQNQFDALACLFFNIGSSKDLCKMINANTTLDIIHRWWISHYTTSRGFTTPGLVARRAEEAKLFCNVG